MKKFVSAVVFASLLFGGLVSVQAQGAPASGAAQATDQQTPQKHHHHGTHGKKSHQQTTVQPTQQQTPDVKK
jgi:Spy/CpxP family protein refolding chaperone